MAPVEIHSHAIESLRYIRDTMERATLLTAVPGRGVVVMGLTALIAAGLGAREPDRTRWLTIWTFEGFVALLVGVAAMYLKAKAAGVPLWSAPARKFALAFAPPVLVGALLTQVLAQVGFYDILPGLWPVCMAWPSLVLARSPFGWFPSWAPRSWSRVLWHCSRRRRRATSAWPWDLVLCT